MNLRATALVFLGALALLALPACEEDVAQVRTEKPFTVFGLLSPALPRQEVYVFPIEERLRPLPPEKLDARVTTTDLATGETVVWEDSVQAATGTGGGAEYVFRAPIDVAYGRTYRLEVARQDGATARVDVTVPEEAALVVGDTYVDDSARPITPVVVDRPVPRSTTSPSSTTSSTGRAGQSGRRSRSVPSTPAPRARGWTAGPSTSATAPTTTGS